MNGTCHSRMDAQGELVALNDSAQSRRALSVIAHRVTTDASQHDDLIQEASVHLWQRMERQPGQRRSWYLQSCFDHLRNFIRRGRSVDSFRRQQPVAAGVGVVAGVDDRPASDEDVVASVCAQDLVQELSKWLTPAERQTLLCLAEGMSLRETAVRLGTSHTTINKHRRKIEVLAVKLDGPRLASVHRAVVGRQLA